MRRLVCYHDRQRVNGIAGKRIRRIVEIHVAAKVKIHMSRRRTVIGYWQGVGKRDSNCYRIRNIAFVINCNIHKRVGSDKAGAGGVNESAVRSNRNCSIFRIAPVNDSQVFPVSKHTIGNNDIHVLLEKCRVNRRG